MSDLVSIIIPVYNAENYIRDCLNSVIKQTYRNIEIILIDDGTLDNSGIICEEYAMKDERIRVIHKKNEGVSTARNVGIGLAKGRYILFVDADDFVTDEYVRMLCEKMKDTDIVLCGYEKIGLKEEKIVLNKFGLLSRDELFFYILCNNVVHGSCCNKIFRADIIKKNRLCFDKDIAVGEDMLFLVSYLKNCNSYYYIDEALYCYRKNEESVMQKNYRKNEFNEKLYTAMKSVEEISNVLIDEENTVKNYCSYRVVRSCIWLMLQMIIGEKQDRAIFKIIKKKCSNNIEKYIKTQSGSKLEKAVGIAICISPHVVFLIGHFAIRHKLITLDKYLE